MIQINDKFTLLTTLRSSDLGFS